MDSICAFGANVKEFSVNDNTVNFWPKTILESAVTSGDTFVLMAEEDSQLTGFIIASVNILQPSWQSLTLRQI